ncbi:hypothetical protein SAY87_026963 [Trapa incisa]|uniref:RING-type domain-containing protein n=1 Tax=Trapa incisa TaxID=236973 RepID=A0AAN7JLG0_9MYRT|nr:hypothetical protein SAY87_026963 [Trapa incisa]
MAERGESSASSSREVTSRIATSSSPSSSLQVHEEGDDDGAPIQPRGGDNRQAELEQQRIGVNVPGNFTAVDDYASASMREDTWSCVVVVLTFWIFVSMTLILGVYGSVSLRLGPSSSMLIRPNPIFVQSLKVEELDGTNPGPLLYGFYKSPALGVLSNWSESYNASVPADSDKEWVYYLNEGSQINITHSVANPGTSLLLVIAQGSDGLTQWLEDPTNPSTTLSWNIIHGSGAIHQEIYSSANYYVAIGNLNTGDIEVELNIQVKAYLYNTSQAYYKCTFSRGQCSLDVLFPTGNVALITTPSPGEGTPSDEWYVKLSYGPRWVTYILGIGALTVLMLAAFNFLNKYGAARNDRGAAQHGQMESARAPLLSYKDDDLSSWGSSYDSCSQDEADLEELLAAGCQEGKLKDTENGNNTRRLCAICFDAPRNCFFLPCGHCVACFECGTRIVEAAGTCPICRRRMKKVRMIYTV